MNDRLNALARQAAAIMGGEVHASEVPNQIVGERIASEFVAALRDRQAVPDELFCAIALVGKDNSGMVRWFLRALQEHLQ